MYDDDTAVSVSQAIIYLNKLLSIDRKAVELLLKDTRKPCNSQLANSNLLVVRWENPTFADEKPFYTVSAFAILTGLFGIDEHGSKICMEVDNEGKIIQFKEYSFPVEVRHD